MAIHLFVHSLSVYDPEWSDREWVHAFCVHVQVNQDSRGSPQVIFISAACQRGKIFSMETFVFTLLNHHLQVQKWNSQKNSKVAKFITEFRTIPESKPDKLTKLG